MRLATAIPSLPVEDVAAAAQFYEARLGFTIVLVDSGFARLQRDGAEVDLWASSDSSWRGRTDLAARPVVSGAESFLAGTASCRIEVDDVEGLFAEMRDAEVLHGLSMASPEHTDYGTREFHALDLAGNLLTFFRRTRD